jgi:hypothetical protein
MVSEWRPSEFVRYLAGNCDSEALLGKFQEEHFIGNVVEYLEKRTTCWQIPVIGSNRTMTEIPYPVGWKYQRHKEIDLTGLTSEVKEFFEQAKKKIGLPLPTKIKTIMKAMALSNMGETETDDAVQIRLWEVIPVVK